MTPLRPTLALGLAAMLSCTPGPTAEPQGRMLAEEDFLADPDLRATPQDIVLVQLHRSDATAGAENGPIVIPYSIGPDGVVSTFCWDDPDPIPHPATLLATPSNAVLSRVTPGEPCSSVRVGPGEYSLVLERGEANRSDPADEIVFVHLGAAQGAALVSNACPPTLFAGWKCSEKAFENVSCPRRSLCEATVTKSRFRGVDLRDSGYPWSPYTMCRWGFRWSDSLFESTNLSGFRSIMDTWTNVAFRSVDLTGARFWYTTLENSTSEDSTWKDVHFATQKDVRSTRFVDTTFLRGTFSASVEDDRGDPVRFGATRADRTTLFKLTRLGPLSLGRTEFDGRNEVGGLTWNNVTLTGRVRGGRYLGITFHGLWLEDAHLDGMVFDGCTFEGVASVASPPSTYARLGFRNMDLVAQASRAVDPDFFRAGIDYTGSILDYSLAPPVTTWRGVDFSGSRVSGVPHDALKGLDLRGWLAGQATISFVGGAPDLTGTVLAEADLRGCRLEGARLVGADFTNARTDDCRFDNADFTHARMPGVSLRDHDLSEATLTGADFTRATLSGVSAAWKDFTNAVLTGIVTDSSNRTTNLHGCIFNRTTGSAGIDLSGAHLSHADLSNAYLSGANLRNGRMVGTDLTGADLVAADLSGNEAQGIILHSANLAGANLGYARLGCDQRNCTRLNDAWLCGANLEGTDLRGATLTGAYMSPTALRDPSDPRYCAPVVGTPLTDATTTCPNGRPPAHASGCEGDEWKPGSSVPITCCVSTKLPDGTWTKCPPRLKKGQPCTYDCDCQSKTCPVATRRCE